MEIINRMTPRELAENITGDGEYGLDPRTSDKFKLIVELDLSMQSYEFTEACYLHFKNEMDKLDKNEI